MIVQMLKDFKWSYKGRVVSYKKYNIEAVPEPDANAMIKAGLARSNEQKMHKIDKLDKMYRPPIENKNLEGGKDKKTTPKKTKKPLLKKGKK